MNFFLFVLMGCGLLINCKRSGIPETSSLNATSREEVRKTGGFFKTAWDTEFETNMAKLPNVGKSSRFPYSGAWYPENKGGLNVTQALYKYDQAFHDGQSKAYAWENTYHSHRNSSWAGHCNGFASASLRHVEPTNPVTVNGVVFQPTEIKALLAEIYMGANFLFLGGSRCHIPNATDSADANLAKGECEDINPGTLHTILGNWLGLRQQMLIMDQSFNEEVWNYPVYQYSSTSQPVDMTQALAIIGSQRTQYEFNPEAVSFMDVQTSLTYADARDGQEFLGYTLPVQKTYRYILELDAAGNIIGGEWGAQSRLEHPDFVWIALEPRQGTGLRTSGNPHVNVDEVLEMWAKSIGYQSFAEAPPPFKFNDQFFKWGKFDSYDIALNGAHTGTSFFGEKAFFSIELKQNLRQTGAQGLNFFIGQTYVGSPQIVPNQKLSISTSPRPGLNRATLQWQLEGLTRNDQIQFFTFP